MEGRLLKKWTVAKAFSNPTYSDGPRRLLKPYSNWSQVVASAFSNWSQVTISQPWCSDALRPVWVVFFVFFMFEFWLLTTGRLQAVCGCLFGSLFVRRPSSTLYIRWAGLQCVIEGVSHLLGTRSLVQGRLPYPCPVRCPPVDHAPPLPKPSPVRSDCGTAWHILGPAPHPHGRRWRRRTCACPILMHQGRAFRLVGTLNLPRGAREVRRLVLPMRHSPRKGALARRGPLAQYTPLTLRLKVDLVRAVPSALWRERSWHKRRSQHLDGLADRGCPAGPLVRGQHPCPGCRARGVHARLVGLSAVNAASCLPRTPWVEPASRGQLGPPSPSTMSQVGKAPRVLGAAAARPPMLSLQLGRP
jgi:hypothetical protein